MPCPRKESHSCPGTGHRPLVPAHEWPAVRSRRRRRQRRDDRVAVFRRHHRRSRPRHLVEAADRTRRTRRRTGRVRSTWTRRITQARMTAKYRPAITTRWRVPRQDRLTSSVTPVGPLTTMTMPSSWIRRLHRAQRLAATGARDAQPYRRSRRSAPCDAQMMCLPSSVRNSSGFQLSG